MLKYIEVENFKAWRKLQMPLGKVTCLFGTNSSGKSSILQLLLLLKQTKNATDRGLVLDFGGPNELVNLGNYQALVHGNDPDADISWTLDWELPEPLKIRDLMGSGKDILYQGTSLRTSTRVGLNRAGLRDEHLSARRLKYGFSETQFGIEIKNGIEPRTKGADGFELKSEGNRPFEFIRNPGRPWSLPGPVKTHLFPDQAQTYYQNTGFLSEFEYEYEDLMDRVFYLGPLRDHPQREYRWSGTRPDGVGPRGERTVEAILAATAGGEKRNLAPRGRLKTFQGMIAYWLQELDLIQSFRIEEIGSGANLYHARVKRGSSSPETMLTDVGFGVSQVLPVLVLLYYVPPGSIVLLEQPEIHLHPSVQSGLGDMILEVAQHRQVQIIVESHSEHLLRRFQRRAAEGTAPSSDLKLYFVQTSRGAADLNDLKLNEWGMMENWPDHFFGDEMGEIAAISTASLERRRRPGASQ